jgi:bile acid:Na+ symporter, BASS family
MKTLFMNNRYATARSSFSASSDRRCLRSVAIAKERKKIASAAGFYSIRSRSSSSSSLMNVDYDEGRRRRSSSSSSSRSSSKSSRSNASSSSSSSSSAYAKNEIERALEIVTNMFPIWILTGALLGLFKPEVVLPYAKSSIVTPALGIAMLGMGVTMDERSMQDVFTRRGSLRVLIGTGLQFSIMPLLGYFVGQFLNLDRSARLGLILVGCCPGGAASNVVAYLANANVSLSVALTTVSTAMAAIMTPLLTAKLMAPLLVVAAKNAPKAASIELDAMAMVISVAQVVVLPVIAGFSLKKVFPKQARIFAPICPPLAVGAVALICSSVIGKHSAQILSAGKEIVLAVIILHSLGFLFGFLGAKVFGFKNKDARTASIEVGMQNSALGVVLAAAHFAKDPMVAVVPAISATVHSCIGSLIAGYWRFQDLSLNNSKSASSGEIIFKF